MSRVLMDSYMAISDDNKRFIRVVSTVSSSIFNTLIIGRVT